MINHTITDNLWKFKLHIGDKALLLIAPYMLINGIIDHAGMQLIVHQ